MARIVMTRLPNTLRTHFGAVPLRMVTGLAFASIIVPGSLHPSRAADTDRGRFSAEAPAPAPSGLVVVPDADVRPTASGRADYAFGTVSPLDRQQVVHTFLVRNAGSVPLTLTQLQPSCHCTTGEVVPSAGGVALGLDGAYPTLQPGQQTAIRVRVVLPGHGSGPLSKSVFVYVSGHDAPVADLDIVGTLLPVLDLTPDTLDFGRLKPHTTRSLQVTATYDARLASDGILPVPRSDNLAIRIDPLHAGPAPGSVANGDPAIRTRSFTVTLRAVKAGSVGGQVVFAPTLAAGSGTVAFDPSVLDVYRPGWSLPITGTIAGNTH